MAQYVIRRILGMIPTFLILLLAVVAMIRLIPGTAVDIMLSSQSGARDVSRLAVEQRLGIDRPVTVQYITYAGGVLHGDLGRSLWTQRPVAETIATRTPATLEMVGLAVIVSLLISVPVGIISALRQDTALDYALRGAVILGLSVPSFALATMVLIFPALWFHWTPPLQYKPFTVDPLSNLGQMVLPALILGVGLSATVVRLMRAMMLEVLRQDYIRTAWSKGLRERSVVLEHALKNALIPVITLFGIQIAFLLSGSVVMEQIFAVPGIGRLLIEAISQRDYPVIQGVTVTVGVAVMVINLIVDLSYGFLDPRVRVHG
jgi:peptide/nickel transport system permease protein